MNKLSADDYLNSIGNESAKHEEERETNRYMRIYFAILVIMSVLCIFSFHDEHRMNRGSSYIKVSENWVYRNGEEASLFGVLNEPIYRVIAADNRDRTLIIEAKNLKMHVLVNGEQVYSTPAPRSFYSEDAPGAYIAEVTIPASATPVSVSIVPEQKNNAYGGTIVSAYLGNSTHIIANYFRNYSFDLMVGFSVIVTGILVILFYIVLRLHGVQLKLGLFFGLFLCHFGLYQIMETGAVSYVFGEMYTADMLSRLSVMLVAVPLLLLLREIYSKEQTRILSIALYLNFAVVGVTFFRMLTGVKDLHENSSVVRVVVLVLLTLVSISSVRDIRINGKRLVLHYIGLFYFMLMTATDLIYEMLGKDLDGFHARVGIVVFFVMESIQIMKLFTRQFEDLVKEQTYKDMATMDALTGCENKYAFDARVAEMYAQRPVVVAIYDVNGLKKVNDTLGHGAGNILILTLTNTLKTTFADLGTIYRIGGDEFAFLSNAGVTRADFMKAAERVQETLREINSQGTYEFSVSAAYGYYVLTKESVGVTVQDALDRADELMYENKKKYGGGRI